MASADDLLYSDDPQADVAGQGWATMGDYLKQKAIEKAGKDSQFMQDVHNKNLAGMSDYANDNAMNVAMGSLGGEGPRSGPGGDINAFRSAANETPSILKEGIPAGRLSESAPDDSLNEAARMARAKAMGFNVSEPVYHGTKANITEFDPSQTGRSSGAGRGSNALWFTSKPEVGDEFASMGWEDRKTTDYTKQFNDIWNKYGKGERGDRTISPTGKIKLNELNDSYASDPLTRGANLNSHPELRDINTQIRQREKELDYDGSRYKSDEKLAFLNKQADAIRSSLQEQIKNRDTNIIPAYLKYKNPKVIDLKGEFPERRDAIVRKAAEEGHDAVIFKNAKDSRQDLVSDVTAVFDPSQIRSKFAAFDPKKASSGNLSAGVAGAGLVGGAALAGNQAEAGENMPSIDDLPPPPGAKSSIDDLPPPPKESGSGMMKYLGASPLGAAAIALYGNPGSTQALGEHALNSASMGYGPEIEGGVQKLGSDAKWDELVKKNRARLAQQSQEHPIASGAGTGLGAVGGGLLMAPFMPEMGAAKGLASIGKAAGVGAAMGGLSNPSGAEDLPLSEQGPARLQGAITGGVTGGLVNAGAQGIGKTAGYLGDKFNQDANLRAVRAAGAMVPQMKALNKRGQDAVQGMGQTLRDEGTIPWLGTTSKVRENIGNAVDAKESKLQDLISDAQSSLGGTMEDMTPEQLSQIHGAAFRPAQVADSLKRELRDKYDMLPPDKLKPAFDEIDSWLSNHRESLTPEEVQKMKVQMNSFLKDSDFYKQDLGMAKQGTLAARRGLRQGVEDQANAVSEAMGDQGGQVRQTNRELGNLLGAQDIAENRVSHDEANRMFGLNDHIMGAGGANLGATLGGMAAGYPGAKVGAVVGGLAGGVGSKAARTFGNSFLTNTDTTIANIMKAGGPMAEAIKRNPQIAPLLIQTLQEREQKKTPKQSLEPLQTSQKKFIQGNGGGSEQ